MVPKYPVLVGEIAKRGIKKTVIASATNMSTRALYNKILGLTPFDWEEVCVIQSRFFPDMDKDTLFAKSSDE